MSPLIAILGAGPAGLMLGRLLELADVDFTIFEKDESASWAFGRGGSGTLDIHAGSGQLALQEAGLLEQFKQLARHNVPTQIVDASGKVYLDVTGDGEDDKPEIDRRDLRKMLLGSVSHDKVRWNSRVQSVQRQSDGTMSIHLASGDDLSGFRLVVGADGAWSKARALITTARPSYRDLTFLTTSMKPSNPHHSTAEELARGGIYIALGHEKSIVLVKLGDGSYYIGTGMRRPEEWRAENSALLQDPDALRSDLHENFNDWAESHRNLIKYSDGAFHVWPQYSLNPEDLEWESVPGVTLVGDAAHLTVADGEGVNAAMYDSYCLAQQISVYGVNNLNPAILAYEEQMLSRSRARLAQAIPSMRHMFSPAAPEAYIKFLMGEMGAD